VSKCDQLDVDSSPQNGQAIKQPFEDDETFFIVNNNGFIDTKADWVIEATNYPASAATGATIPLNFMLRNNGRLGGAATTTTIYLSTDALFSANDQFLSFQTAPAMPAFGYNLHNTTLTLPAGLANGQYYLLFSADFAAAVDEADENNVFARAITITGGGQPTCSINASVSGATCNNAGTPTNPADDTWTFDLTVTGTNTSAGWSATVAGQPITGAYGVPRSVSGGLISAGNRTFSVIDATITTCNTGVVAVPPTSCSAPACQISATVGNILCQTNGTINIPGDDYYVFSLNATATNASTGYRVSLNGVQVITATYGQNTIVTGPLITAGVQVYTLTDLNNAACSTTVTVTPPANSCSGTGVGYCTSKGDAPWEEWISNVQVGAGTQASTKTQYSDFTSKVFAVQNGTAVNLTTQFSYGTNDEYWRIWIDFNSDGDFIDTGEQVFEGIGLKPANALNVTKTTTGSITLPANTPTGDRYMRVAMKRGAFPTPCETFPFGEVEDYTAAVSGGGTPPCSLSAAVSNAVCNNAGTPNNAADDTWTFNLTVNGTNAGATGWTANVAGQTVTGTYGTPRSVNGGLISAGVRAFAVGDITTPTCTTNVSATPPASCSTPNPCTISATVSNITCNDNGTPTIATDDTYGFTVLVTGTNGSSGWQVLGPNALSGVYGVPKVVTGIGFALTTLTLTAQDLNNSACATTFTVTAPAPCSNPNPGIYCPSKGEAPWEEWIGNVQVGTGSQASTKTQYSDFTSKVFAVQNGTAVSLTTQFSYTTNDQYWRIWIDLNNDNDFIDAGEQVFEGIGLKPANALNATKVTSGSVALPANAPTANRRMRVAMKRGAFPTPCETFPFGEVEDYTAAVTGGGNPPTCAISGVVNIGACNNNGTPNTSADDLYNFDFTITGTNTSAGWTATGASAQAGTYGAAKVFNNVSIAAGTLTYNVRDNANAACTTTITVVPPAPCSNPNPPGVYCVSKGDFPWEDWIGNVKVGLTNRPTSKEGYLDNTSQAALVITPNTAIELTANYSYFTYDEYWRVWIDLNKDGDFIDAGEQVFQAIGTAPAAGANVTKTTTGILPFPTTLPAGTTRMRVAMKRGAYATPCETFLNGEVEDYTVAVGSTVALQSSGAAQVVEAPEVTATTIAPNPAYGTAQLLFAQPIATSAEVRLLNQFGAQVLDIQQLVRGTEQINLDLINLPSGMYYVQVRVAGERAQMVRLVVAE
jgi:GEVED domain/Secretion system C-terminal sorting domain/CARDB